MVPLLLLRLLAGCPAPAALTKMALRCCPAHAAACLLLVWAQQAAAVAPLLLLLLLLCVRPELLLLPWLCLVQSSGPLLAVMSGLLAGQSCDVMSPLLLRAATCLRRSVACH